MTRINTNVSSLVAQNTLGRSNASLNEALTRLSTGLRINTGKDDPAGLIASENLRSDITAIRKAITNTDRANQVIATADSALGQVSGLLNDIRGLVTEAANTGALSNEQIAANQLQVDSSLEALNRIAQTTTFQGRRLLDGSLDFITTAGTGFGTVTDLKIDQANLGATGQVAVSVDITSAATQATIANTAIAAGSGSGVQASGALTFPDAAVASTGQVAFTAVSTAATAGTGNTTFTVETVAEVLATTGTIALTNGSFSVTAVSGGIAGGATGNTFDIDLIDNAGATTVTLNGTTIEVRADLTAGTVDIDAIVAAIDGHDFGSGVGNDFNAATVANGGAFAVVGDAAAPLDTFGSGVSQVTVNAQLNITADASLGAGTTTVQFATHAGGSAISITGTVESTITVSLQQGTAHVLNDIAAALAAYSGIDTAVFASNGTATFDSDNDSVPANASVTGGADAVSTTQTINITGTAGAASNIDIQVVESASVLNGTPVVSGDAATGYVVSVSSTANTTVQAIRAAIEGLAEVATATYAGTATYDVAANTGLTGAGVSSSLIGGLDTADDVITITADAAGTTANGVSVTLIETNGQGATPTAQFNGANIEVLVDDTATTTLASIVTAIDGLAGYSASLTSGAGNGNFSPATDNISPATLANGAAPGGLDTEIVLEISGTNGAEVLSFGAGSSLTQIVAGINGVSDATGVSASDVNGDLVFTSIGYGSAALVSVKVLDGDDNGTFAGGLSATRDVGTDIVATVNGIAGTGTGNSLVINTATLDLTLSVDAGSSTDVNFTIAGGGALFQLGPDVVSNQQARIGITSVNTAKLGGVSGKLFQLGSGGSASLAEDTTTAGRIVEEAINQITSLRGRLGAFQRTTLETNKQALNDTLVNLTEAESQIRDSDFAAETANLTRAQILVQSGTVVLQISNQNPQNVLALLQ